MRPMAGSRPYSPAAGAKGSVDGRASRLEAANEGNTHAGGASSQPEKRLSVSIRNRISDRIAICDQGQ